MYSKIIWRLNADRTITQVIKGTTKLYANSGASTEYGLVGANIAENDVVYLIANRNGEEFTHRLKRGLITYKDGTVEMGWKAVTDEGELNFNLESGTQEIKYSFDIKRFSALDGVTLMNELTSSTDTVNVYPGSSYHPQLEPTEAEVILADIAEIEAKISRGDLEAKGFKIWQATLIGNENPTITTIGELGQYYYNNANDTLFVLTSIEEDNYYWSQLADSGTRGYNKNIAVYDKATKRFYISKEDANLENVTNTSAWEILEQQDIVDLFNMIGDLADLETQDKSNLVKAINEVNEKAEQSQGDITALEQRVSTNETNISNLQTTKQDKADNGLNTTNKTVVGGINELKNRIDNYDNDVDTKIQAHNLDITAHPYIRGRITNIEAVIPSQASSTNQLADKDFTLDAINSVSAFYITKDAIGNPFNTKADLDSATTFYSGGEVRTPTRNDYCYVLADITKGTIVENYEDFTTTDEYIGYYVMYEDVATLVSADNKDNLDIVAGTTVAYVFVPTTRYSYQNGWQFQVIVNETPLTINQLKALNSGITVEKVTQFENDIEDLKDDKLDKEVEQENEDNITSVTLDNNGQDFSARFVETENGVVTSDKEFVIDKTGIKLYDNEAGEYVAPLINGEEITGITEIELTGESGTLTDDEFAKIQANANAVVFSLDGRKYIHNEDATNYVSYSNTIYPTTDTQSTKVIYVNTSSEAVNYKHWNVEDEEPSSAISIDETSITENTDGEIQAVALKDKGKKVTASAIVDGDFDGITHFERDEDFTTFVNQGYIEKDGVRLDYNENGFYSTPSTQPAFIDIGSSQLQLEADNKIYPKMTVGNAKLIYEKYKAGKPFTIKWTLSGISLFFSPVNATTMTNSFVVLIHDKFIKYEWTNSQLDTEEISPVYEAEQTWTHIINCDATTAQGQYKYQFQFRDTDASEYSMLYEVAEHLNEEYSGVRLPASGTYTEGANVYLVTSVEASSSSQIAVTMTKLSDGSERVITTGAVAVTDSVHK